MDNNQNSTIHSRSISFKTDDDQKVTEDDRDFLIAKLKEFKEEKEKLLPKNKLLLAFINGDFDRQKLYDAFSKLNPSRLEDEIEESKKLMDEFLNFKLTKIMQQKMINDETKIQEDKKVALNENLNEIKKDILESTTEFLQSIEYPNVKSKLNRIRKLFRIQKEVSKIRLKNIKLRHALKLMKMKEKEVEKIGENFTLTAHGKLTSEAEMLAYKRDVGNINIEKAVKIYHRSKKDCKKSQIIRNKVENVYKEIHKIAKPKETEAKILQETKNQLKFQINLLQMKKEKLMNQSGLQCHQNLLHHFDSLHEKLEENKKSISELEICNREIMNKIMQNYFVLIINSKYYKTCK